MTKDILSVPTTAHQRLFGLPILRAIREDPLGLPERLNAERDDMAWLKIFSTRICYVFNPETGTPVTGQVSAGFRQEEAYCR